MKLSPTELRIIKQALALAINNQNSWADSFFVEQYGKPPKCTDWPMVRKARANERRFRKLLAKLQAASP